MVREDKLSDVLSEFARTVITDFPIQRILDHLVQRIVGVLSVTGSGVTLISPGAAPYYVAASDELALRFERLQSEFGQGPCLTAYDSGEAVAVPDLAVDARYPQFGPVAVAAGMAAVFTFPLRHATGRSVRWTCTGTPLALWTRRTWRRRRRSPMSRLPTCSTRSHARMPARSVTGSLTVLCTTR